MNEALIFLLIILFLVISNSISLIYIIKKQNMAQATLDDLQQKVNDEATVEASAITLLEGLSAQLAAAKNDPAKVQAIADQLDANKTALAASVLANTPSA